MKTLISTIVLLACTTPVAAQGAIFADDFESGRTCWVWSRSEGSAELCFDSPFGTPPPVAMKTAAMTTDIQRADLIFGLDTTGSMGGEIANIKASAATILNEFLASVPDGAIGVAGYDDYPYDPYGIPPDQAFYLLHRVMTASTPNGVSSIQNAINLYTTHRGGDTPESGWEMVFQTATGAGSGSPPYGVLPFDPATAPPTTIPAGEEVGEFGGVGIREGSMPILVWISDADSHNSSVTGNTYSPFPPGVVPANSNQALAAMTSIGGKIIGVMSGENARPDLEHGVVSTGAVVHPDAWGTDLRPAGCGPGECCTGFNGTGVPPTGGASMICPLLFEISANGAGLGTAIVDGLTHLVSDSGSYDIWARLVDDPGDPVNAADAFLDYLEADDSAPPPCTQGLTAVDLDPVDGIPDTFLDVAPGSMVCFNVVPKTNVSVPPTGSPEIFLAFLEVIADGVSVTATRNVFFRVAP